MNSVKQIFLDVETTGTDPRKHCIHQLSGHVVINGNKMEEFDYKIRPHERSHYDPKALEICGVTKADLIQYPHRKDVWSDFYQHLRGVDKYDTTDKFFFCAYNAHFDNGFMRKWFEQCGEKWFGSFFWSGNIDVMVLALHYLQAERHKMSNFKLMTVAKHLGIEINEEEAHDSLYDIIITRKVYDIVTKSTKV